MPAIHIFVSNCINRRIVCLQYRFMTSLVALPICTSPVLFQNKNTNDIILCNIAIYFWNRTYFVTFRNGMRLRSTGVPYCFVNASVWWTINIKCKVKGELLFGSGFAPFFERALPTERARRWLVAGLGYVRCIVYSNGVAIVVFRRSAWMFFLECEANRAASDG